MPPKNAGKGGASQSKKADQKKKDKIIEDKTFGLKNKKGAKQQRFIQQVQNQVKFGGNKSAKELEKERENKQKQKDDKKKELQQLNELFKPVQQLASKGSDPKSILCAFFKQGQCGKGQKCKFSHDLNVERKSEKRSAYVDIRDNRDEDGPLDQAALLEMVEKKQGKHKNTSEKVCKHFLDAVENSKYGWFWECPNGDGCLYRHALPPGYILKKDRKKMEKQKEEISLEELVDRERAALGPNTTKVTLETFMAWKKRKLKEKEEKEKKDSEKKKKDFSAGRNLGLSGREMFTFNPNLIIGGDEMEEGDESFDVRNMEKDPENEEEDESRFEFKEIDMTALMSDYQEVDTSTKLSIAKPDRLSQLEEEVKKVKTADVGAIAAEAAAEAAAVDIDEELFDGDDEDLDDLEEQLGEMTVT